MHEDTFAWFELFLLNFYSTFNFFWFTFTIAVTPNLYPRLITCFLLSFFIFLISLFYLFFLLILFCYHCYRLPLVVIIFFLLYFSCFIFLLFIFLLSYKNVSCAKNLFVHSWPVPTVAKHRRCLGYWRRK